MPELVIFTHIVVAPSPLIVRGRSEFCDEAIRLLRFLGYSICYMIAILG